jgi:cytochrome d ubiquinol oxidase subunit II
MLLPIVGKDEAERRAVVTTLGPVWDGNEVWVLVAGGATFAAFPEWYATLFSGFYLPLFLILVALIVRGVAFEYRSKRSDGAWRARWDAAIVFGSFLPALLWGVAFSNIVRGVPLVESANGNIEYDGGFFNLLNPFALLGGLTFVAIFLTHGAIFLSLKTTGEIRERAYRVGMLTGLAATVLAVVFLLWAQLAFSDKAWTWIPVLAAAVAWLGSVLTHRVRREGLAFTFSALTIALAVVALFGMLYPNVMPNIDPAGPSLTVDNASSTDYTLTIMTWVAVIFTPIVLAYQSWTYWVFRKRVGSEHIADAEAGSLDTVHVG